MIQRTGEDGVLPTEPGRKPEVEIIEYLIMSSFTYCNI